MEYWPVDDGPNGQAIGVLPPSAGQTPDIDKMLPDKTIDNTVITIVKQKLARCEFLDIYFLMSTKEPEVEAPIGSLGQECSQTGWNGPPSQQSSNDRTMRGQPRPPPCSGANSRGSQEQSLQPSNIGL